MRLVPRAEGFLIVAEDAEDGFQLGRMWSEKQSEPQLSTAKYNDDNVVGLPCILVNLKQMQVVDEALNWEGTGLGRVGRIEELIQTEAKYLGSRPMDTDEMKRNAPEENVIPFKGNVNFDPTNPPEDLEL